MSANSLDLLALLRAELDEHRRRMLDDFQKAVETALAMNAERYMTRLELAKYVGYPSVQAMNTAWCRARKSGTPDRIEAAGIEIGGVRRWRKATVDAVLAMKK